MIETFGLLFGNIVPLYGLIALGYIAGRYFNIDRQSLAGLAIKILLPLLVFGSLATMKLEPQYIALPLIYCSFSMTTLVIFFWIGKRIYGDGRANLLGLCCSMGNGGYFGLPIVFAMFPQELVSIYILMMVGAGLIDINVSYYMASRGNFSVRESLIRVVKLPSLYGAIAGIAYNLSGLDLSETYLTYNDYFKGSYIVIGMMIIGGALSKVEKLVISPQFLGLTFLGKSIVLPALALGYIWLDHIYFQSFTTEIYKILYIMAIVPTAANVAAFAVEVNLRPEKAATTILIGTLYALILVPLSLVLFDAVIVK